MGRRAIGRIVGMLVAAAGVTSAGAPGWCQPAPCKGTKVWCPALRACAYPDECGRTAPRPAPPPAREEARDEPAGGETRMLQDVAVCRGPAGEKGAPYSAACDKADIVRLNDHTVWITGGAEGPREAKSGIFKPQWDGLYVVSLGAEWCGPCCQELGDLVELAKRVNRDHPRLVFVFSDPTTGAQSLIDGRNTVLEKHRRLNGLVSRLRLNDWVELRSDVNGGWAKLVENAFRWKGKSYPKLSLPVNMIMDRCGNVLGLVEGSVTTKVHDLERLATTARQRDCEECIYQPPPPPPPPPPPCEPWRKCLERMGSKSKCFQLFQAGKVCR